ncbi:MAG: exosortase H-associated membrane protein [Gammaproteobacteria bacterium]
MIKPRHRSNPLRAFGMGLAIAMPCCLAFWWFIARNHLLLLMEYVIHPLSALLFANHVIGLDSQASLWTLKTSLSPIDNPLNLVAIPVSTTRFTICFPLLWGLILAMPERRKIHQLITGTLLLFPLALLIVLLLIQFKIALYINHQPIVTETPRGPYLLALPYPDFVYYLTAVGRQLAMLVLPTLAPLLIWGVLNFTFMRTLLAKHPTRETADANTTP